MGYGLRPLRVLRATPKNPPPPVAGERSAPPVVRPSEQKMQIKTLYWYIKFLDRFGEIVYKLRMKVLVNVVTAPETAATGINQTLKPKNNLR